MILKEANLEDLNKICAKVENPNKGEDYQCCIKAYSLRLQEQYEGAISLYEKALKINKENQDALKGISLCYKFLGKFTDAIKYSTKIKHLTPFEKSIHYELGVLEYNRKNYVKSIKNFITAIKLSPEYYDAIYALGQSHEALEEYEMAEMIYLKIIENRPSYIIAYNRLANMYLKIEDYKKAIRYFREILAINPDFHRAYLGLGIAFDKNEQPVEAKRYYKKYIEMKPFSEDREYVEERLNKLRPVRTSSEPRSNHLSLVR